MCNVRWTFCEALGALQDVVWQAAIDAAVVRHDCFGGGLSPCDGLRLRFSGVAVWAHCGTICDSVVAAVAQGDCMVYLVRCWQDGPAAAAFPLLPRCHYFLFWFCEQPFCGHCKCVYIGARGHARIRMSASFLCATGAGTCGGECGFHEWVRSCKGDIMCGVDSPDLHVALSMMAEKGGSAASGLRATGTYRKRQRILAYSVGVTRLLRFLRVARELSSAPWANKQFVVNEQIFRRLTASHLAIIVGEPEAKAERGVLMRLLSVTEKLDTAQNLCWITNRQQGKTTTVGKFLACISLTGIVTGLLATVYSTSLDRAQELVKAAKQYLYWYNQRHPGVKFVRDTDRMYTLLNLAGCQVEIAARPKNTDSCRGDAPACAFFDEVGFVQEAFWYKFAYPLLQVTGRTFSCITTPPPRDGFFDVFCKGIQERNARGDFFFTFINHSLACQRCVDNMEPERCTHRLHLIPPWKSILKFVSMRRLIPKSKRDSFATEVFGVLSKENSGYFPPALVDAGLSRTVEHRTFEMVWVGVDPASHSKSEMALVAIGVTETGLHVICGICSVNVARCEVLQLTAIVRQFVSRLRKAGHVALTPVVETNANEIVASTIVRAFGGNTQMPFTSANFSAYVTDNIGVLTTQSTKMAMIQQAYLCVIDGRVAVADNVIVADRSSFEGRARLANAADLVAELGNQLKRFRDQADGTVSGKGAGGENDDIAMAFMMTIYWRVACIACGTYAGPR